MSRYTRMGSSEEPGIKLKGPTLVLDHQCGDSQVKKIRFMSLGIILALLALSACTQKDTSQEQVTQGVDQAAKLNDLVEQYWQDSLVLNPMMASFVGDNRYNDRYVGGISPAERAAELDLQQRSGGAAAELLRRHDWPVRGRGWRDLLNLP